LVFLDISHHLCASVVINDASLVVHDV